MRSLRVRRRRASGTAPVPSEPEPSAIPPMTPGDAEIAARAAPLTLTSPLRVQALLDAVAYCVRADVPGAFAECGVWRGGSVLAIVLKLQELGVRDRDVFLYDTFEGMTAPSERDTSAFDQPALQTWCEERADGNMPWEHLFDADQCGDDAVRALLVATGYPEARLRFVKGPVEDTLPQQAPDQLALLHLDTDWYESTRHELEHLYPRLARGGVLIIDDYGHWDGCRQAVDEYFSRVASPVLLNRIDYTGRIAVKT